MTKYNSAPNTHDIVGFLGQNEIFWAILVIKSKDPIRVLWEFDLLKIFTLVIRYASVWQLCLNNFLLMKE